MDQQEIIQEIKALSSHYPRRAKSPADELRWLVDYANDLAGYPPADVRMVCAMWRASTERRMPSPGELIAKCRNLEKPEYASVAPPPRTSRPPPSVEERESVKRMMEDFAVAMANKRLARGGLMRLPGETDVDQARRLWPSHEVRR